MVNSEIGNAEINKRAKLMKDGVNAESVETASILNDEEVLQVILREVKKEKTPLRLLKAEGQELAEKEKEELVILMTYMPEQLSEGAIRDIAKKAVERSGAKGKKKLAK